MLTLIVAIFLFLLSTIIIDKLFGLNKTDISEVCKYYSFACIITLAIKCSYYLAEIIVG